MRIKLNIEHLHKQRLPVNYQYIISAWIYKTLYQEDSVFADWLHEHGYVLKGKKYKHFCFSKLLPRRYTVHKKEREFELTESPTVLYISFNIDKGVQHLIKGIFQNNLMQLKSGRVFQYLGMIQQVEVLQPPVFSETMLFTAQTPICISVGTEDTKYPKYISPLDEGYPSAFAQNLVDKANAYLGTEKYHANAVEFQLGARKPKQKLWSIKGISIKGYEFNFELTAPKELIEIGYYAGFGVQNSSLGMGFCEVVE